MNLSPAQIRLLKLAGSQIIGVRAAAGLLGVRTSNVSDVRNTLHRYGLVEEWRLWDEPIILTDEGKVVFHALGQRLPT